MASFLALGLRSQIDRSTEIGFPPGSAARCFASRIILEHVLTRTPVLAAICSRVTLRWPLIVE